LSIKKVAFTFLALCSVFFLYRFCQSQTDGFSQNRILFPKQMKVATTTPPLMLEKVLDQPFFYLGKGAQAYAFASEDGHYVLKFFRQGKANHPLEPIAFVLPKQWKERLSATVSKRKTRLDKEFASYRLAGGLLRKETGLLFLHLDPTSGFGKTITLYDKIGVKQQIDLDKVAFVLQKKADLLYPTLERWVRCGEKDKAKQALTNLINLLEKRSKLGVYDKNPDLKTNFGFINTQPIQFDIGRFSIDFTRKDEAVYRDDLIRITDRLCKWLNSFAPELSEHLLAEVKKGETACK